MRVADARLRMRVSAVDDLPWPHHPFRCAFPDEFDAAVPEELEGEERHAHIAQFATALTPERLRACPYHEPNWHAAADTAIRVWTRDIPDLGSAASELMTTGESRDTVEGICSFFGEPIFVNGAVLGNGQHRVCAMKLSGVPRCLIEV